MGTSGSFSVALAHYQLKWPESGTGNPWKTRENLVGMARPGMEKMLVLSRGPYKRIFFKLVIIVRDRTQHV